jgi:flagellar biosynthesis GTPase FlhF
MKRKTSIWVSLLLALAIFSGCSGTKETESAVEDELSDFRNWISTTTSNLADHTEEDWKQAKQDFSRHTSELDQKQDKFTAEVKQEYQQLKQKFNDADEEYQQSHQMSMSREWEQTLLGNWSDMSQINENNVREAYITFMENVRANKGSWNDKDWEMAKMVLENLNKRKSQLTGNIPTDTEVKIKALQMEFRTLETAADVKD